MLIAIISDTHLPRGRRRLPDVCRERLAAADLILHAGDISTRDVLTELEALGPPVLAVHGNVDSTELREELPAWRDVRVRGARIVVVHDAGPARGRPERLRRGFPAADAVVFGHSHVPVHHRVTQGFQIFNPGSPTERRRQAAHTMGLARVTARGALSFELVILD